MTDLSKWDYANEFLLYEAAALIAGIDPAAIYTETKPASDNPRIYDYHEHPLIKPVVDRMKFSFHEACDLYFAMHKGHWHHDSDEPMPELVLRSREMEAIPLEICSKLLPFDPTTQRALDAWLDYGDTADYETRKFTRVELSRWLSINRLVSVYSFDLESSKATMRSSNSSAESGELTEMNTMKALAVMAWLLAENKGAMQIGGKPNAAQIGTAVAVMAKKAFGEDTRGFESFHKKIGSALKLLDGKPF